MIPSITNYFMETNNNRTMHPKNNNSNIVNDLYSVGSVVVGMAMIYFSEKATNVVNTAAETSRTIVLARSELLGNRTMLKRILGHFFGNKSIMKDAVYYLTPCVNNPLHVFSDKNIIIYQLYIGPDHNGIWSCHLINRIQKGLTGEFYRITINSKGDEYSIKHFFDVKSEGFQLVSVLMEEIYGEIEDPEHKQLFIQCLELLSLSHNCNGFSRISRHLRGFYKDDEWNLI